MSALFWRALNGLLYFGPIVGTLGFMNLVQCATFVLSYVSPGQAVAINGWLFGLVQQMFQDVFERVAGIECVLTGDDLPGVQQGENALVLSNHLSYTDFLALHSVALRKGVINGVKYFAKEELKWIPLIGFGIQQSGMIMLKRNWEQDERSIARTFAHLRVQQRAPLWLVCFLEGTRFTERHMRESHAFAERVLQREDLKFEHVLIPRTKGFLATVGQMCALPNRHITHIYDFTIGYGEHHVAPNIIQIFTNPRAFTGFKVYVHVKRFAISELPPTHDKRALADWCYERFKEKEKMISNLKRNHNGLVPDVHQEQNGVKQQEQNGVQQNGVQQEQSGVKQQNGVQQEQSGVKQQNGKHSKQDQNMQQQHMKLNVDPMRLKMIQLAILSFWVALFAIGSKTVVYLRSCL